MAIERTITIVKPDAVGKNVIGKIYSRFEENGLRIVAAKMKHLSVREAQEFYAVHKERPFYDSLVAFMTSGPVMIQVLEGENAVAKNRELMGATNPAEAANKIPACAGMTKEQRQPENPRRSRSRYDTCRFCRISQRKRRTWFRQSGKRSNRDCLLLQPKRNLPALTIDAVRTSDRFGRLDGFVDIVCLNLFSDDLSHSYGNKATLTNVNRHLSLYHFLRTPPPLPNAPLSTQQGS